MTEKTNPQKCEDQIMQTVTRTTWKFYLWMGFLILIIGIGLYGWYLTMTGQEETASNDMVPWGMNIASYIFFIGISHAGIAVSAAARLLNSKPLKPLTRIAELITIFGLIAAGLTIVLEVIRADRLWFLYRYFGERQHSSPFIGGTIATYTTYLLVSIVYLYFSMREDLVFCRTKVKGLKKWLYKILVPLYSEKETKVVNKLLWWMAIAILPIMAWFIRLLAGFLDLWLLSQVAILGL